MKHMQQLSASTSITTTITSKHPVWNKILFTGLAI